MKVKFPAAKKELVNLEREDQAEVRGHSNVLKGLSSESQKRRQSDLLARRCHARADTMLEILGEIKDPTIENIGLEGSKAVSLLALHSYLDVMKKILSVYERNFQENPVNIYYQAIPSLTDRIMILERRIQLFGTNWSVAKDEKIFLIPVKDFATMNQRRARYGLKPTRRPVNLSFGAIKYPLGKGMAVAGDQKELSDEEYEAYARYSLKSLI